MDDPFAPSPGSLLSLYPGLEPPCPCDALLPGSPGEVLIYEGEESTESRRIVAKCALHGRGKGFIELRRASSGRFWYVSYVRSHVRRGGVATELYRRSSAVLGETVWHDTSLTDEAYPWAVRLFHNGYGPDPDCTPDERWPLTQETALGIWVRWAHLGKKLDYQQLQNDELVRRAEVLQ